VAAGFYILLFGLTWMLSRPVPERPGWWGALTHDWLPKAGLAGLGLAAFLVWGLYFSFPDERLKVTVLDVGAGDAILIQTPSGANVLIDGGPSGSALAQALARELPLFTTRLDLLVVAGPQDAHVGGLPDALARYAVTRVVVTGAEGRGATYQTLMETLNERGVQITGAADLPVFDLGDGITLRVLDDGEKGSALLLEYGSTRVVMPVGSTNSDLTEMLANGLARPAAALVLGDPAAGAALTADWVAAINPQAALISASAENARGDALRESLLLLAGCPVLNTAQSGSLTLLTVGRLLWVETAR
jgi:competence protein ComEC